MNERLLIVLASFQSNQRVLISNPALQHHSFLYKSLSWDYTTVYVINSEDFLTFQDGPPDQSAAKCFTCAFSELLPIQLKYCCTVSYQAFEIPSTIPN